MVAAGAAYCSLASAAQVAPEKAPRVDTHEPKWGVYAGFSYTSLNQVNQSRHGLVGFNGELTRAFGRYFAVVADGGFYPGSIQSGNPGNPSVSMVLGGVEVHGNIFEKWAVFGRGLIGGEHTGGNGQTPSISFAGGPGIGVEYQINSRWAIRASGDYIGSAFSFTNNTPEVSNSPHRRFNARAGAGVVYRF